MDELLPIGIYTIPEISFVGRTEERADRGGGAYEIGISRYRELARGQILGDTYGHAEAARLARGPHACSACTCSAPARPSSSTSARRVMAIGRHRSTYLVDTVFNYPTLAESYKVAALDATNRLSAIERMAA